MRSVPRAGEIGNIVTEAIPFVSQTGISYLPWVPRVDSIYVCIISGNLQYETNFTDQIFLFVPPDEFL
jgi:hypothetical protein